MNRREFMGTSLAVPLAMAAAPSGVASSPEVLASQTEIARAPLRPEDDARLKHIPTQGALKGERYIASAPDTLDLAERLKLLLVPLTNRWFPKYRWAEAFHVHPGRPFAMPVGASSDWVQMVPKFVEAFVYDRLASGSDLNLEVDRKVIATQLGLIGEDGLSYVPEDPLLEPKEPRNYSDVFGEGRWLMALTMLAQVDQDPRWEAIARKKIDRLLALSSEKEGFRYFWNSGTEPHHIGFRSGATPPPNAPEPQCTWSSTCDPAFLPANCVIVGQGAAQFYRLTHYPQALELSRGMAQWALARIFNRPDGRYFVEHYYHGVFALMAVAWYAGVAENEGILRHVDACYRWARDLGDPLVGWYSGYMPGSETFVNTIPQTMETCGVVPPVIVALFLSQNGIGDYWDDVDRWVRNRLAASQVTSLESLERIPLEYLTLRSPLPANPAVDMRNIAARSVGSCFSAMMPNDGFPLRKNKDGQDRVISSLASCCVVNPSRAMFYIWDSIVRGRENGIQVNLLLNRASEWVDVASYLPVEGKVAVKVKKTNRVKVRMPEWVALDDVAVSLNGRRVEAKREGRYLGLASLSAGDEVVIQFPVLERTVDRVIARWPYRLTLRGADVVAIDPPGRAFPLYQNQSTGKLVTRERFLSARKLVI